MAIAFDAQSTKNKWTLPADATATWSHTCTGSNLLLFVNFATNQAQTVTGVTYNGVSMTQLDGTVFGGNNKQSTWYLVNPSTGPNNIVATFSSALAYYDLCAVSLTGVRQTTPLGTPVTAFSDSTVTDHNSAALTTTAANSWAIDSYSFGSDGGSITADSSQTLRASSRNGMTGQIYTKLVASPASVQMDTTSAVSNNFSHVTAEVFAYVEASSSRVASANRVANTGRVANIGDVSATGRVAASF